MRPLKAVPSVRWIALIGGVLIFVYGVSGWGRTSPEAAEPEPPSSEQPKRTYREFPHSAKAHQMACNTCHKFPSPNWKRVRSEKEAFPDVTEYPRHESCLNCHMQQFFKGAKPNICGICHTNPGPRGGERHPFPNPREAFDASLKTKNHSSDFLPAFPHEKHVDIVASRKSAGGEFVTARFRADRIARRGEESCSVCHQTMMPQGKSPDEYLTKPPDKLGDAFWIKKGTFKGGPNGHTACFACHSADTGILPAPDTCSACHSLKSGPPRADFDPTLPKTMAVSHRPMVERWARRYSSGTFAHEHFAHADLACATCHTVNRIKTDDPATKKVPIASCATCHATPTLDDGGALNYEVEKRRTAPAFQCVKCHITFGKLPIPASHIEAVKAAAK